ncbi:MAG: hypothetical protein QOK42_1011 [Frankiaceae bacterium]|jgi:hypothetical protein|nr:hypothetical protein [Frankiaceae bacterium]MDX6274242.1 hypothetical protein [Frankiales bacterium]
MDTKKAPWAIGLVAAGAIAGGVLASSMSASAATDTTPSATGSTATATDPAPPANRFGSAPIRPGEKAVSDAVGAKLKAAALKAVPGGTVYRVETDADGDAYEAHMTKADGTLVTVKFDSSYNVTSTEEGMGRGGHGAPPAQTGTNG